MAIEIKKKFFLYLINKFRKFKKKKLWWFLFTKSLRK